MKFGDRVTVCNQESEWFGCRGVMNGVYLNGSVSMILDRTGWEISLEPHDIELEELSGEPEGSISPPLD